MSNVGTSRALETILTFSPTGQRASVTVTIAAGLFDTQSKLQCLEHCIITGALAKRKALPQDVRSHRTTVWSNPLHQGLTFRDNIISDSVESREYQLTAYKHACPRIAITPCSPHFWLVSDHAAPAKLSLAYGRSRNFVHHLRGLKNRRVLLHCVHGNTCPPITSKIHSTTTNIYNGRLNVIDLSVTHIG